jgi:hypothetical protein
MDDKPAWADEEACIVKRAGGWFVTGLNYLPTATALSLALWLLIGLIGVF